MQNCETPGSGRGFRSAGAALLASLLVAACVGAREGAPRSSNASASEGVSSSAGMGSDGWRSLFNGKNLAGWEATGNRDGWVVEGGSITQVVQIDLRAWSTADQNPDGTPNKFRSAYSTMTQAGHTRLQDHGPAQGSAI